jgi:lysine 2,3-aminomutase
MVEGVEHFRTPIGVGLSIMDGLRGHVSGLAVPRFAVDVPGGFGKVTLAPNAIVKRHGRSTTLRTYTGESADVVDPAHAEPEGENDSDDVRSVRSFSVDRTMVRT